MTSAELFKNIQLKKSFLCVGLDTDFNRLPKIMMDSEYPLFEFNKRIIDATSDLAVAYKPNMAFYESMGTAGWMSLELTVKYLRENYPDLFLIADAKRGDIGNTSKMYATAFLENMDFDAITVSPYMGADSVKPFIQYKDKWIIILALTSNEGSHDFQMIFDPGANMRLFEKVLTKAQEWGSIENTMFVVGATQADKFKEVRKVAPDHFLLVPGVGAQGGSLEEVAKYGLNKKCGLLVNAQGGSLEEVAKYGLNKKCGLLVNASRSILYADATDTFADSARMEAEKIQQQMAHILESYHLI